MEGRFGLNIVNYISSAAIPVSILLIIVYGVKEKQKVFDIFIEGVKEGIETEGLLGLLKGGLTASAAGISAALIFGYLASVFSQPKMKK